MSHLNILTLTWHAEDRLSKLHKSLMPALEGLSYDWFIKDNKSKDNTVEVASQWGNHVKVIPYKDNMQNFSEGVNYLFNIAAPKDDDYILLLNNDVEIKDSESIKRMIDIMEKDKFVGAVGGRLLYTGTNKLQHAGVVFDPQFLAPIHYRLNEESDAAAEKNRLFQVVTGAVLLTKAEYFRNICTDNPSGMKGMCEGFRWAFDDVDMCLAINYNLHKKIVYCGKTEIHHEESASLKKNPANRLFMRHNINLLRSKWAHKFICDKNFYEKDLNYNLYQE